MHASNWNKKPLKVLKIKIIFWVLHEINSPWVLNEEK